jgi:hypothetical protein
VEVFLRNHADGIASMDLFVVPTISFRLLYGFHAQLHGASARLPPPVAGAITLGKSLGALLPVAGAGLALNQSLLGGRIIFTLPTHPFQKRTQASCTTMSGP